jgi:prepilin-type processing-associated H-X9-DG protein
LTDIADGSSTTFAMGDAAAGTSYYLIRDMKNPGEAALDLSGRTVMLEQSWSAPGTGDREHPWYGSVFAVTAQFGLAPDPRDEPMNRRPATPAIAGGDPRGDNRSGRDFISGFRSRHLGGCNFLFCDGGVRFVTERVSAALYRALATYAGGEVVAATDF